MSDFITMAPQSVQDERTRFFHEYARRYAEAKTIKTRKHLQRQAELRGDYFDERRFHVTSPVPTDIFPRKYLMHSLRCLRMAPTEEELADAERDVFNPKDTTVTLDQFLEICDSVRCIETDVDSQDVLANFRSAIVNFNNANSSSSPAGSPGTINSLTIPISAASASPSSESYLVAPPDLLLSKNNMSNTFDIQNSNRTSGCVDGAKGQQRATPNPPQRRYLTRAEMRDILSAMTDEEFQIAMQCVDPQNTNQIDIVQVSALLSGGGEAYAEDEENHDPYDGHVGDGVNNKNDINNSNNTNNNAGKISGNASDQTSNCSSQGAQINHPTNKNINSNRSTETRSAATNNEKEKAIVSSSEGGGSGAPIHTSRLQQKAGAQQGGNCCGECVIQ